MAEPIIGKLDFHSETGTEGGYYTMMDSQFITYQECTWGVFSNSWVYDPSDIARRGRVSDAKRSDGSQFDSAKLGDVSFLDIDWDDDTQEIGRPSSTVLVERWSYNGIRYVQNSDRLTIYALGIGSLVLWSGVVELEEQDPYANESFDVNGLASHHRPVNTEPASPLQWSQWFLESRWALLERPE